MQGQISFNADGILETVEQPAADAPEIIQNAWKKAKQDKVKEFREKQELSYEDKIARQSLIAKEFYDEMQKMGCGCHVSVGGLDSITLYVWLHSMGYDVPAEQMQLPFTRDINV